MANIYFWRAVGWNEKGNYKQVIADAREAIKLKPDVAFYNLRGSAYYDKSEYDIAISDFNDGLRIGPASGIVFHNRGNAWRGKGDYGQRDGATGVYAVSGKSTCSSALDWAALTLTFVATMIDTSLEWQKKRYRLP